MDRLLIQSGDNSHVLRCAIEHEWQFHVLYGSGAKARVAFHGGTWRVMRGEDGESFEFYDGMTVDRCDNPVLAAFMEEKAKQAESEHFNDPFRQKPAWVISEAMEIWVGKANDIVAINVERPCRDGWFEGFDSPWTVK